MTRKKKTKSRSDSRPKVRYAVVGQGYISQIAVLPAFANANKNSQLVSLVSDDPEKLKKLSKKYGVEHTYSYDEYDECLQSGNVDAIYLALPNHLHCDYSVRAARAGIHVLCEKPMAVTVSECQQMIDAFRDSQTKLMIAYRLHFEEANLKAVKIAQSGKLGELRIFNSLFTMQVEERNIRLKEALGGGTLYDIGIYCINAARYLFQDEPLRVFASTASNGEVRFSEVEEMTSAVLEFPKNRLASFTCSFGATDTAHYEIVGTEGSLKVDMAYKFANAIQHTLTIRHRTKKEAFSKRDQFAPQLLYFSDCILQGKEPEPSGQEGLIDVRIIEALYSSAENSSPVNLGEFAEVSRPTIKQEIKRPPVKKPRLVHAKAPSET